MFFKSIQNYLINFKYFFLISKMNLIVISTIGRNLFILLLKISQSPKGMPMAEDSFEMTNSTFFKL
ncbi:MAG TPA: hypothetical protein DHV28_15555 [Ignavibacteriales bacterium]|nr:hypothetical protein [Ignavibacteriales bacterium]